MPDRTMRWNGHEVALRDLGQRAVVHRHFVVRIGANVTMAGEVLSDARHARGVQAGLERLGKHSDRVGLVVQGPVADDARFAVVHVEHRREAEVHAVRLELAANHEAATARRREGLGRDRDPSLPSSRIGGIAVKPCLKRCTRPPSWSTAISSCGVRTSRIELASWMSCSGAAKLRPEEDHSTHLGMLQALDVVGRELGGRRCPPSRGRASWVQGARHEAQRSILFQG